MIMDPNEKVIAEETFYLIMLNWVRKSQARFNHSSLEALVLSLTMVSKLRCAYSIVICMWIMS